MNLIIVCLWLILIYSFYKIYIEVNKNEENFRNTRRRRMTKNIPKNTKPIKKAKPIRRRKSSRRKVTPQITSDKSLRIPTQIKNDRTRRDVSLDTSNEDDYITNPTEKQLEELDNVLYNYFDDKVDDNLTRNSEVEKSIVELYNQVIQDDSGFDTFYRELKNNLDGLTKDEVDLIFKELQSYPETFPDHVYEAILMRVSAYVLLSDIRVSLSETDSYIYDLPSYTFKITKDNQGWVFDRIKNLNTNYIIKKYTTITN